MPMTHDKVEPVKITINERSIFIVFIDVYARLTYKADL